MRAAVSWWLLVSQLFGVVVVFAKSLHWEENARYFATLRMTGFGLVGFGRRFAGDGRNTRSFTALRFVQNDNRCGKHKVLRRRTPQDDGALEWARFPARNRLRGRARMDCFRRLSGSSSRGSSL